MTKKQKILCNTIIHTASAAAGSVGLGLAQVPGSDSTIIVPIQLTMTISLGKVFGLKISAASAKSAMGTTMTTMVGRAASQVLVGWIPVAGNIINASTAASITEALGWILAHEFEKDYSESLVLDENEATNETLIESLGDDNNDGKAENNSIKAFKEIRNQFKVLQENRFVG